MKIGKILLLIAATITLCLQWKLHDLNNHSITGNRTITDDLTLSSELISPGNSPGVITVTGNFSMQSGATYKCELKNTSGAGSGHDQIDVSGNVTLDGTLDIILDGYIPSDNDNFAIISYGGTLSGTFSSVSGLPTGWSIDYGVIRANTVSLYKLASTLPVELISFDAQKTGDNILISWQTASEQNSDYFDIEHSADAINFKSLSRLNAQGNASTLSEYTYMDKAPTKGINYYRLKQMDIDGKYEYSHIVSATIERAQISFYPNPAKDIINFDQSVKSVVIYDMMGKEILRKTNIASKLDVSKLAKGIYLIDINSGSIKQKLIVE